MVKLLISHSVSSSKNGSTDHGVMSLDRVIAAVQTALRARFLSFIGILQSVCTHSPGTNSTKAMAAMLVFQTKFKIYKILLNWNINMGAVTSCLKVYFFRDTLYDGLN
jgi:hypothetical protein